MDTFGFKCAKNTLMILNVFYIIVGIMLAAVGGHLITSNKVTSLPIIGGIVACGVFLILISLIGIYGAARHHQVLLFFYMIILFLIFFIQFVIACVCLGVSTERENEIARFGWKLGSLALRDDVQRSFECCGYDQLNKTLIEPGMEHPNCTAPRCQHYSNGTACPPDACCTNNDNCACPSCKTEIGNIIEGAFYSAGVTSLLFSFTEFIGIWLTRKYRNMAPEFSNLSSRFGRS